MKKKTEHYLFAHVSLPYIFFNRHYLIYDSLSKGPEKFSEFLNLLWETEYKYKNLFMGNEKEYQSKEFKIFIDKWCEDLYYVTIVLPKAEYSPEAVAISFTLSSDEKLNRYFTYELGVNEQKTSPSFFICEWTKDKRHLNYGSTDSPSLKYFEDKIKSLLIG